MRFQAPWSCVTGTRQAVTEPSSPYLEHGLVLETALAATGGRAGEGGFVKAFDFTRVLGHLCKTNTYLGCCSLDVPASQYLKEHSVSIARNRQVPLWQRAWQGHLVLVQLAPPGWTALFLKS